jgi:hypothetical protein
MDNLKKMEMSWREMEDFGQFFEEDAYHESNTKEFKRRYGDFYSQENGQPSKGAQQTIPSDEASCQRCLRGMRNWPGRGSILERWRRSNAVTVRIFLFKTT